MMLFLALACTSESPSLPVPGSASPAPDDANWTDTIEYVRLDAVQDE